MKTYKIKGMHCASCATMIESELEDAGFVAKCSWAKQQVEIEDNGSINEEKVKKIVSDAGYEIVTTKD